MLSGLSKIWRQFSKIGINGESLDFTKREIILSNQISLLLLPITAVVFYFNFVQRNLPISIGLMLFGVMLLAVPLFNFLSQVVVSRLMLSVLPNVLLLLPPILYGSIDLGNFQGLAFTTVALSVLPLLLFNYHNERGWFVFSLLANVIVVASYDIFLKYYVDDVLGPNSPIELIHTKIPQVYLVLIIISAFVFYQRMIRKYQSELIAANESLQVKNEEILASNQALIESKTAIEEQRDVIEDQSNAIKFRNKTLIEQGYVMLQLAKSEFVQKGVLSGALEEIVRTVSLTLNLSRVSIWEVEEGKLVCKRIYSKIKNQFYEGQSIDLEEIEKFHQALNSGEILVATNAMEDLRFRQFFQLGVLTRQIRSVLSSPYYVEGKLHGLIFCEQAELEHSWKPEDINLVKVASDILTIAHSSSRFRSEAETIKEQHQEIMLKNEFIESQKEQILAKNRSLEASRVQLENSLQELRDAEANLNSKDAEARGILDAISDHNLVVEYDLKGDITWMNESTRELMHITNEDLKGAYKYSIKSLLLRSNHFNHMEYDNFWSSMMRGVSRKYELKIALPGNELWVAATFLPIRDAQENIHRILVVAHDISTVKNQQKFIENQNRKLKEQRKEISMINNSLENRVAERTQQLEQQNQQLTEYAFINAHLLRAPVCNILGLIDLLKNGSLDDGQTEIVQFLDESTKELDEMVMKINRAIKKGYYDDPHLTEQVKNWKKKREMREQTSK